MNSHLPPGPRTPSLLQTIGWWSRPTAYLERCRARYGKRFTLRLLGQSPFVILSDPEEIKQVFLAPPDVLHPGEGARSSNPSSGRTRLSCSTRARTCASASCCCRPSTARRCSACRG